MGYSGMRMQPVLQLSLKILIAQSQSRNGKANGGGSWELPPTILTLQYLIRDQAEIWAGIPLEVGRHMLQESEMLIRTKSTQ